MLHIKKMYKTKLSKIGWMGKLPMKLTVVINYSKVSKIKITH